MFSTKRKDIFVLTILSFFALLSLVWITAFVMMITRSHSEVILRVPNMLCCIFTVLFLYRSMIKIKKDRLFAFLCSFVLLSTFMFIKLGAENTWDIYTYSFIKILEISKRKINFYIIEKNCIIYLKYL